MPIISLLLPKILSFLGFDASQKLRELEIHTIPELKQMLREVEERRMLTDAKKDTSSRDGLDKLAAMLKPALYEAEDILDLVEYHRIEREVVVGSWLQRWVEEQRMLREVRSLRYTAEEEVVGDGESRSSSWPHRLYGAVATSRLGRWVHFIRSGLAQLMQWTHKSLCWFLRRSYDVVGISSYQENAAAASDSVLPASSRRDLKKRIEKVESTVREVKKSPLLGVASKSSPSNKERSKIRSAGDRKVFGRRALRDDIMAKLREAPHGDAPSSSSSTCYSVIGIVGIPGSGKTTMAQYIRKSIKKREKELFDTIICIHVSETFIVDDIFHEMLKDITGDPHPNIKDGETLQGKLKEKLKGKRFFLILDDIWVENKNGPKLQELLSPLNVGKKGSKILVTARTKRAARALCADEPIKMPDLDEEQYLSMFMYYALNGAGVDRIHEFEPIGKRIAEKLHLSPIAAKTVAGQLRGQPDTSVWENTATLDVLNDTRGALWWSYQQLNADIRRCFELCSIFPRRHQLRKDELVSMWIAQGFVKTSCATEDMEDVAEGYIQELVSCSFLQPNGTSCDTEYFTIHDLLHDLAEEVAGTDCFRIENPKSQRGEERKRYDPPDVRHLFVQNYDGKLITEEILKLKNLRTLIIYNVGRDTPIEEKVIESVFKRLRKLRVVAIASSREWYASIKKPKVLSVPESISQLKHLRYLAFRTGTSCIVILPSTLTKLYHMQLLDFGDYNPDMAFPSTGLINLRHVYGVLNISNIGRLTSLQTTGSFTVRKEQGYEVKQLGDLNKLRGTLSINDLENVESKDEALKANLAAKERLTELNLCWGGDTRCSPDDEAEVLESLCPPVGLEILTIRNYKGSRYPNWMVKKQNRGPEYLQQLVLYGWSHLGPALELKAFIHLRFLEIKNCMWDTLPGNMEHLTSLKSLMISECLNIRSLPALPQSLEKFTLVDCNDILPGNMEHLTSLKIMKIMNCLHIRSLPTLPRSLKKFVLFNCNYEFMKSCQTDGHLNCEKIKHIPKRRWNIFY